MTKICINGIANNGLIIQVWILFFSVEFDVNILPFDIKKYLSTK